MLPPVSVAPEGRGAQAARTAPHSALCWLGRRVLSPCGFTSSPQSDLPLTGSLSSVRQQPLHPSRPPASLRLLGALAAEAGGCEG